MPGLTFSQNLGGSGGGGTVSPLTTKGDLYGYNTGNARIAVGTDGLALVADSTNAAGVSYGQQLFSPVSTSYTWELYDEMCLITIGSQVGPFSWFYQGTAARDTPLSTEKNRQGIMKIPVATATSGGYFCDTAQIVLGGALVTWASAVYLGASPNGTDDYLVRTGLNDSYSTQVNGCFFTVDRTRNSANWVAVNALASSVTTADTGVPFTATTWTNLRIVIDSAAAAVLYFINGVQVASLSTNIPTVGLGPMMYTISVASAVTKTVRVDWTLLRFQPATSKGTF